MLGLSTAAAAEVQVEFYGESLCPDCRDFTTQILAPLYENGLENLFSLQYIGTATEDWARKFFLHLSTSLIWHAVGWDNLLY